MLFLTFQHLLVSLIFSHIQSGHVFGCCAFLVFYFLNKTLHTCSRYLWIHTLFKSIHTLFKSIHTEKSNNLPNILSAKGKEIKSSCLISLNCVRAIPDWSSSQTAAQQGACWSCCRSTRPPCASLLSKKEQLRPRGKLPNTSCLHSSCSWSISSWKLRWWLGGAISGCRGRGEHVALTCWRNAEQEWQTHRLAID